MTCLRNSKNPFNCNHGQIKSISNWLMQQFLFFSLSVFISLSVSVSISVVLSLFSQFYGPCVCALNWPLMAHRVDISISIVMLAIKPFLLYFIHSFIIFIIIVARKMSSEGKFKCCNKPININNQLTTNNNKRGARLSAVQQQQQQQRQVTKYVLHTIYKC